jgi:hypothetical protein
VEEKLTIRRSPNFMRGSGKKLSFRSIRVVLCGNPHLSNGD